MSFIPTSFFEFVTIYTDSGTCLVIDYFRENFYRASLSRIVAICVTHKISSIPFDAEQFWQTTCEYENPIATLVFYFVPGFPGVLAIGVDVFPREYTMSDEFDRRKTS